MRYKLDSVEQEIENEAGQYKTVSSQKKEKIKNLLKKSFKRKIVTLRLNNNDLGAIKSIAVNEGIPYQTLISSVLHKYVNHRFYDKDEVAKLVRLPK